jgi:hypothetical protein
LIKEGLATDEKTGDIYRKTDKNNLIIEIGRNTVTAGIKIKILNKN